jgi:hypothetical protein
MHGLLGLLAAALVLGGCQRPPVTGWQGYLEAEFIHVGAPLAGEIGRAHV